MKELVLMYVYYDKHGDIKAISPSDIEQYTKSYEYILLPLPEVEPFLLGQKNTFDYIIKKIKKLSGYSPSLTKKFIPIDLIRTLDTYLTEIPEKCDGETIVRINADVSKRKLIITMNELFKEMYNFGTDEEKEIVDNFVEIDSSILYITEKRNPYSLLTTITFIPKELFDKGKLYFDIPNNIDLQNSSAYTKRLVSNYTYSIKE